MKFSFRRKPSNTIVLVSRSLIVRIDYRGRRQLEILQVVHDRRDTSLSLTEAVKQAVELDSKPIGKLSIVSSSFWTGLLTLPADVVSIATADEISQALALEAEADSEISAFDSRIAFRQLVADDPREVPFCATQVSPSRIQELKQIARTYGSKLQGLAHPVALELSNQPECSREQAYELLSRWDDVARLQLSETNSIEQLLQDLAADWSVGLIARSTQSKHVDAKNCDQTLWISPELETSAWKIKLASATVATSTCLACWLWYSHNQALLESTNLASKQLEKERSEIEEADVAIAKLEPKLVQLRKEANAVQTNHSATSRQLQSLKALISRRNQRWPALIDALAETAADCWIQKIESENKVTTISGLAKSIAEVNAFTVRLEATVSETDWKIAPAVTHPLSEQLFEFSIELTVEESIPSGAPEPKQVVQVTDTVEPYSSSAEVLEDRQTQPGSYSGLALGSRP